MPWLLMAAGAPADEWAALTDAASRWAAVGHGGADARLGRGLVACWGPVIARVPPGMAARACAAGLAPEEALAGYAAGTLEKDGLRSLAALRGYRLPDVVEAL